MTPVAAKLAAFLVRHRRANFIAGMLLVVMCAAGLPLLHVNNDYRVFFDDLDPYLVTTDWLNARQGLGNDIATMIYRPADGDITSVLSTLQLDEVVTRVRAAPNVLSVESWLDAEKLVRLPDGSLHRAGVMAGVNPYEEPGRAVLRADVLSTPTIATRTVGRDGRSAAVYLFLDSDSSDTQRLAKLTALFQLEREIEADLQRVREGDSLVLVGSAVFDYAAQDVLRNDVRKLMPIAFGIIFAVLWVLFHSLRFALASVLLVVLPSLATAGSLAFAGVTFTTLAISGLLLVGTLAVADIMHIGSSFFIARSEGQATEAAARHAIEINLFAVGATSLTTAIGQIAMLSSASPPIQVMGLVIMVGVWLALLLALLTMPQVLFWVRVGEAPRLIGASRLLGRVGVWSMTHNGMVAGASVLLVAVSAYALSYGRITDSLGGWFSTDTEFRQGMDLVESTYVGADSLTVALEAPIRDQLAARAHPAPSPLFDLYASLRSRLDAIPHKGEWYSPVDAVRAASRRLGSGTETSFAASGAVEDVRPFSAESVARSGLMTRLSFGARDYTLWRFDPDHSSSFGLLAAAQDIEVAFAAEAGGRDVRVGGLGLAFASLSARNFESIVTSSFAAFLLISLTMFGILRSLRLGIVALFPNLAPILVALGGWGVLVGEVNMAVATVFSVAMGLVVDDTIHILVKYQHYLGRNLSPTSAMEHALINAGPGVLATTLVISSGFFLLGTSDFLLTAQKATLVGVTIVLALVFDLVVLPAVVAVSNRVQAAARTIG
jgi:uncharacterized protein